ncbi:hypothetical protein HORIV_26910 [Vreelandella olivaria]|uniref:Uncharacterized protein n=1 Tax=Vreelandella olivaria TaxID=390919 RepID=A0ABM7GIB9_9GAMM|nr:hypothetical protein HORIV_26910 [Halomonas olivaria]
MGDSNHPSSAVGTITELTQGTATKLINGAAGATRPKATNTAAAINGASSSCDLTSAQHQPLIPWGGSAPAK